MSADMFMRDRLHLSGERLDYFLDWPFDVFMSDRFFFYDVFQWRVLNIADFLFLISLVVWPLGVVARLRVRT